MRGKILKPLLKKFRWSFLLLFLLTFLVSFLTFLTLFNFRNNFSLNKDIRGKFDYVFGRFSVIKEVKTDGKIYIDWTKLILILFLLYFPLKITIQLVLNYWQKYHERKTAVYLTKKLLNFAYKNKDLIARKKSEKVYIINNSVPVFCRQFFAVPVRLFRIITDISFELFWLFFLVNSRNLFNKLPFISAFILANLIWLILFYLFTSKTRQEQEKIEKNYQQLEENQLKLFLENLKINNKDSLAKLHKSLDNNSRKLFSLNFNSLVLNLPNLIVPGFTVLFLYLYYNFWLSGVGSLGWDDYFIAYSVQKLFSTGLKIVKLLPDISSWRKNYQQIESFFD